MITKRDIFAIIFNLFIFTAELIIVIIKIPGLPPSSFSYYTLLSNLMGLVASFFFLLSACMRFSKFTLAKTLLRYYATCMLALTFIIVIAVLLPMVLSVGMDPAMLFTEDTAMIHHVINPALSFISFVFLEDNSLLTKAQPFFMLCITTGYGIILIILNLTYVVDGPYPFLQVYNMPVWMTILWFVGIGTGTYFINLFIYKMGTRRNRLS